MRGWDKAGIWRRRDTHAHGLMQVQDTHAHGHMQVHKSSHSHAQLHIRRHVQTCFHTLITFDRELESDLRVLSRFMWTKHGDPTRKAPSDGKKSYSGPYIRHELLPVDQIAKAFTNGPTDGRTDGHMSYRVASSRLKTKS